MHHRSLPPFGYGAAMQYIISPLSEFLGSISGIALPTFEDDEKS